MRQNLLQKIWIKVGQGKCFEVFGEVFNFRRYLLSFLKKVGPVIAALYIFVALLYLSRSEGEEWCLDDML